MLRLWFTLPNLCGARAGSRAGLCRGSTFTGRSLPVLAMDKRTTDGFTGRIGRIEELIRVLDGSADKSVRSNAGELVRALLEIHAAGMERMLEIVDAAGAAGEAAIAEMTADDLVSNLMLLHGLHPVALETRVRRALDSVRPRLGLHGGNVELLDVTENGEIRLRLQGNCHGCPSSQVTLKYLIEEAIYAAAPDASGIEVEGAIGGIAATERTVPKFAECPLPQEIDSIPKQAV